MVTPTQHAAHTAGIQATRSSFGLGSVGTALSAVGNNIKTNASKLESGAKTFAASVKQGGINPFGLTDIARGNVK